MTRDVYAEITAIQSTYVPGPSTSGTIVDLSQDITFTDPLSLPDGSYTGRTVTVSNAIELSDNGTFTITNHVGGVLTTDHFFQSTEGVSIVISDDTALDGVITALQASLNATSGTYFVSEIPKARNYFDNYEKFVEVFIGHKDKYQDVNTFDALILNYNNIILEDNSTYINSTLMTTYKNTIEGMINEIEAVNGKIDQYIVDIKLLLKRYKIVEIYLKDEEYINYFNAYSTADQTAIQDYIDLIELVDKNAYLAIKQEELQAIKIV